MNDDARNYEREDDQNCLEVFMHITCYSCPILMNLEFPRQFLEKILK
jgi:hypothetical protein